MGRSLKVIATLGFTLTVSACGLFNNNQDRLDLAGDLQPLPSETQPIQPIPLPGADFSQEIPAQAVDVYAPTETFGYASEQGGPLAYNDTGDGGGEVSFDNQYGPSGEGALRERVIYFDYNQDGVRSEFRDLLAAHGRYLAQNPQATARLEGHTDERGTREYNIALGERRSKSVMRMLMLEGAQRVQLFALSLGEESPIATEHNEAAYARNRRVEIVYENR